MRYITLVCCAGMSTSLLMKKMNEVAAAEGKEVEVVAMSEGAFAKYDKPTDVLLLGPQVRYLLLKMKRLYEPKGIKVDVADMRAYGQMNGKKILNDALALLGE